MGGRDRRRPSKFRVVYAYNHEHDSASIADMLKMLAAADEIRNLRKAKAHRELSDMVSQGVTCLQQLVQNPSTTHYVVDTSDEERGEGASAAATTDTEGATPPARAGQSRQRQANTVRVCKGSRHRLRSPSISRLHFPPPRRSRVLRQSTTSRRSKNSKEPPRQG